MDAFFNRLRNEEIVRVDKSLERSLNCRDPKDVKFLTAAVAGDVPYLVSGDDDILACAGDPGLGSVHVVRPREFLQRVIEQ
jgi:predicted nucleic acid-binding protein